MHFGALDASVVVADRNGSKVAEVVSDIHSSGGHVLAQTVDLADPTEVRGLVKKSVEALGRVDILVNNAATLGPLKAALDLELTDWRSVMDTNLTGTFLLSQAAAHQMIAQGSGGAIVNILTIQKNIPLPNYSADVASKGE